MTQPQTCAFGATGMTRTEWTTHSSAVHSLLATLARAPPWGAGRTPWVTKKKKQQEWGHAPAGMGGSRSSEFPPPVQAALPAGYSAPATQTWLLPCALPALRELLPCPQGSPTHRILSPPGPCTPCMPVWGSPHTPVFDPPKHLGTGTEPASFHVQPQCSAGLQAHLSSSFQNPEDSRLLRPLP